VLNVSQLLGSSEVEFHLTYQGPLPAQNSNREDAKSEYKQKIRLEFAEQLASHWNREWLLQNWKRRGFTVVPIVDRKPVVTEFIRYNRIFLSRVRLPLASGRDESERFDLRIGHRAEPT
jgi:hypothetical protein